MWSPQKLIPLLTLCLASLTSARISITGATTGINSASGEAPPRLNINTLHKQGGPAWTLYVRALAAMQEAKSSDASSYFQIAGIHGRPLIPWDGDGKSVGPNGYCPHAQVLVQHALTLAEEYPANVRAKYRSAAQTLRIPYWDWADDATIPPSVGQAQIQVDTPKGKKTIRNPLYSYNFPKEAVDGKYGSITGNRDATKTVRCSAAEANARMAGVNFKGLVYDAFTRSDTFAKVASVGSDGVVMSFEQPHNSIHVRAACGNNFAYTSDSAFDPLFMLHHANVDRLWAMWEELYPNQKALSPPYKSGGTFAIPRGTTISNTSPMLPFYGPGNKVHTSAHVQDISTFGYTYPEIPKGVKSTTSRRNAMKATVNKLYGPAAPKPKTRRALEYVDDIVDEVVDTVENAVDDEVDLVNDLLDVEFFANIRVNGSHIPTPCEINVYIGGKVAGSFDILTAPHGGGIVEGEIPLEGLVQAIGLGAIAKTGIQAVSILGENVHVEILHPNGTAIPYEQYDSEFEIDLVDIDVTLDSSPDVFPQYGESRHTPVRAKPAPLRKKCGRRNRYADIPGVKLRV
ncbi:hypothetical protein SAPIO_CDS0817 [Scedosporium apiospermum]|uniref:tyrosinase n=1 Tax=Pseudallescheria apiosperma TaxID=563466 RepID=A0A084GGL7_PSEDA|nr:uncharacterized protein SAPIO_CDS0817 [Scedosporium apiospermum]KEZ46479.1 hypothetical protein SAPIO_CDS0817 [Scedosporium apiospermum]